MSANIGKVWQSGKEKFIPNNYLLIRVIFATDSGIC